MKPFPVTVHPDHVGTVLPAGPFAALTILSRTYTAGTGTLELVLVEGTPADVARWCSHPEIERPDDPPVC